MLYVLIEPVYKESIWCNEIISGISSAAKEKRISLHFAENVSELTQEGHLILVATTSDWIGRMTEECNEKPLKIVVVTPRVDWDEKIPCSFIGTDTSGAMANIMSLLKDTENVALYGVNPDSVNDICKKNGFLSNGGSICDVYFNNGNIKLCFEDLFEKIENYGAILCTNSYAALYLVRTLKEKHFDFSNLEIISLSDSRILQFTSPKITALGIDYKELGRTAFETCRILAKNPMLSCVTMTVNWQVYQRETSTCLKQEKTELKKNVCENFDNSASDIFYNDISLSPMMSAENLLHSCDDMDLKIISHLQKGVTYDIISEKLFVSESAIKYRIKKMLSVSGVQSREELLTLLKKCEIAI